MRGCWRSRTADTPFLSAAQTERGLLGSSESCTLHPLTRQAASFARDGIKTGFKQAAWPQESNLPDTECLFSHSKCLRGALSPETEHVNSSAWGTGDPAWGGTRGGQAWGDTAAALIHPAPRSSEHCCSRGERCWRAHRRTLLSTVLGDSRRHIHKMQSSI